MSRRVPKEYLGAFKRGHRLSSKEFIDDEFSLELLNKGDEKSLDALKFLTKFNNEYHKAVLKKGDLKALHNTDVSRKECYSLNNRRNRDAMNVKGQVSLDLIIWKRLRYHQMIENDEAYLYLRFLELDEDGLQNIA